MGYLKGLAALGLAALVGGCATQSYRPLGPGVLEVSADGGVVQRAITMMQDPTPAPGRGPAPATQPVMKKMQGTSWTETQTHHFHREGSRVVTEYQMADGQLYRIDAIYLPNRPVLVLIDSDAGPADMQAPLRVRTALEQSLQRLGVRQR